MKGKIETLGEGDFKFIWRISLPPNTIYLPDDGLYSKNEAWSQAEKAAKKLNLDTKDD